MQERYFRTFGFYGRRSSVVSTANRL